jgi:anti-anti-sigma regulatory factor
VTVHGEHDLNTQNRLAFAIERPDLAGAVLIDFSDADFIDSSTLLVLLRIVVRFGFAGPPER